MQSKAFERSVSSKPNDFPLSTHDIHFSNIVSKQFWALNPFRKPHWYFDNKGSIKFVACLLIIFSNYFEIVGRILTGR